MKKTLFGLAALCLMGSLQAQTTEAPVILDELYILHISPNGKYAGSSLGEITIYDIINGESHTIEGAMGLGNALSDNGIGVGDANGFGIVIRDGVGKTPNALTSFFSSTINAITTDGTKITGFLTNPELSEPAGDLTVGNIVPYIPFTAELDEQGEIKGEVTILPFPEKDFFGGRPQYVLGNWISDDGKTILGQMTDSFGRMHDPVVYTQDENGEWSYVLPTEAFFNPNHLEIPANPWVVAPPDPNIENFMSPQEWEFYQEDLWSYLLGQLDEMPVPEDYMNNAQIEAYYAAVAEYEEFLETYSEEIKAFEVVYRQIMGASPNFMLNDMTLSRDGKKFGIVRSVEDYTLGEGQYMGQIYLFNYTGDDADAELCGYNVQILGTPYPNLLPSQILADGTLVAAQGKTSITTNTYLVFPDNYDTFISVEEYFESAHPNYAEWMKREIPHGTGVICIDENWTTFTSALQPEHFAVLDEEGVYTSIIFSSEDIYGSSGIENILSTAEDEIYRVYNLQGVNILTTSNAADINTLTPGLYIINGKKTLIRR